MSDQLATPGAWNVQRLARLAALLDEAAALASALDVQIDLSDQIGVVRYEVGEAAIKEYGHD